MEMGNKDLTDTVIKLFEVEGLKFGKFTVRTGESSPVYVDMRVMWSYPDIVISVSELIWEKVQDSNFQFDHICGLPNQGVPIASYLSTKYKIPMLMKRKEQKKYGTCRYMEGHYKAGDKVLLIDDVVMTGSTLKDDIPIFREEGLEVVGTVVFIDRSQGGADRVKHIHGTDTLSVVTLPQSLDILHDKGKLTGSHKDTTLEYLRTNRFDTGEYGVDVK